MGEAAPLFAAFIGALGQAAGGAGTSVQDREWQDYMYEKQLQDTKEMIWEQNQYNTSEREAAQVFNKDMWNETNQYNAPASQLARMTAAGINPNAAAQSLIGGSATPVSITGQSASNPNVPASMNPNFHNPLEGLSQLGLIASQIGLNRAEQRGKEIENDHKDEILTWTAAELRATCKKLESDVLLNESVKGLNDANKKRVLDLLPLELATSDQELQNLKKAFDQYEAQIDLLKEQKKTEEYKQSNLDASSSAASASAALSREQINTEQAKQDEIRSQENLNYEQGDKTYVETRREIWKNTFRAAGVDPDSPLSTNLFNLVSAHSNSPDERKQLMSAIKQSLDLSMQERKNRKFSSRRKR